MWPYRVYGFSLPTLLPGLYDWTMSYDPDFLGYMQGVIEMRDLERKGGYIL